MKKPVSQSAPIGADLRASLSTIAQTVGIALPSGLEQAIADFAMAARHPGNLYILDQAFRGLVARIAAEQAVPGHDHRAQALEMIQIAYDANVNAIRPASALLLLLEQPNSTEHFTAEELADAMHGLRLMVAQAGQALERITATAGAKEHAR